MRNIYIHFLSPRKYLAFSHLLFHLLLILTVATSSKTLDIPSNQSHLKDTQHLLTVDYIGNHSQCVNIEVKLSFRFSKQLLYDIIY